MSRRRGATALCGILPIDKPAGLTSHDVVNAVRRATGEGRVGHAGTLDPMATGLLVVLVGPATRLAPWLSAASKTYVARIQFGTRTDTDDADGEVVATAAVPPALASESFATAAVMELQRTHLQVPPAFSAIKVEGRVAHRAARSGEALDLEPREVSVERARLLGVSSAPVRWEVELTVSKGTYVRALARDLGHHLGTEAHLAALRRTASGTLVVEQAHVLANVEAAGVCAAAEREARSGHEGAIEALFSDPIAALGLPVVEVGERGAALVANGAALTAGDLATGIRAMPATVGAVAISSGARLLGVYESDGSTLYARVVLTREAS